MVLVLLQILLCLRNINSINGAAPRRPPLRHRLRLHPLPIIITVVVVITVVAVGQPAMPPPWSVVTHVALRQRPTPLHHF